MTTGIYRISQAHQAIQPLARLKLLLQSLFRSLQFTYIPPSSSQKRLGCTFEIDSGNSICKPSYWNGLSAILTNGTLACGVAASRYILSQNVHRDGRWDNLYRLAISREQSYQLQDIHQYVFNKSANLLEDALGLVIAGGLSIYWGDNSGSNLDTEYGKTTRWGYGTAIFSTVQVGLARNGPLTSSCLKY